MRALRPSRRPSVPGIHIFIATSDIHLKHKLMMSRQEVVDAAVWAVAFAKKHLDYVEFSAEDASRSDLDYLVEVFTAVIEAGARTVNVPDTTGYAIPERVRRALPRLDRASTPGARPRHLERALPQRPRHGRRQLAGRGAAAAPGRSSAPSTASASVPATPRWKRS